MKLTIESLDKSMKISDGPPAGGDVVLTTLNTHHEIFDWVVEVTRYVRKNGKLPPVVQPCE